MIRTRGKKRHWIHVFQTGATEMGPLPLERSGSGSGSFFKKDPHRVSDHRRSSLLPVSKGLDGGMLKICWLALTTRSREFVKKNKRKNDLV